MALELTPDGLSTQTQEELVEELAARLRSTFGNNLTTSTDSIMGQLVNIISELNGLNQQQLLAAWRSFDPNSATGVSLDQRANLTGSIRKGATSSSVVGILTFSGVGTAVNGDLIHNDDNDTDWQLIDGPIGPGPGAFAATFAAVDTGPILANAGTTWSVVTVIPGGGVFTNPVDDANPGRDQETDPDFRIRRQTELFSQNVGGLAAITAVVSRADDRIILTRTYHNPATSPVDSDGIPFKAFNVVVETNPVVPPADLITIIFEAIFSVLGAGGEAFGTDHTGTVTDSEGTVQPVAFDVVDLIDVFITIVLDTTGTEEEVSSNLAQVVADEVLEVAQRDFDGLGENVLGYKIAGIISDLAASGEITGVVSTTVQLSLVAVTGPFVDPVPIGISERADYDSVNISVSTIP